MLMIEPYLIFLVERYFQKTGGVAVWEVLVGSNREVLHVKKWLTGLDGRRPVHKAMKMLSITDRSQVIVNYGYELRSLSDAIAWEDEKKGIKGHE